MTKLRALVQETVKSPFFFAYWGVNVLDKVTALLPPGALPPSVRTLLGAGVAVASATFFFKLLRVVRNAQVRRDGRSAWDLFLSLWAYRLKLILSGAPLAVLMIATGSDKAIVDRFNALNSAPPEQTWEAIANLVSAGGIWGALFLAFCLIDTSGTGIIVAQGTTEKSLRNSVRLFPAAAGVVAAFLGAELVVGIGSFAGALYLGQVLGAPAATLAVSVFTTPLSFLLQITGMLYIGVIYLRKTPQKLSRTFAPESIVQPSLD